MQITASMVKELRERTGAGMMECKKALTEAEGDMEAAIEVMRRAGQAKAIKKSERVAAEGRIVLASSADGHRAAIVEVNSETDFVAKDDNFVSFAEAVASRVLEDDPADVGALMGLPMAEGGSTVEEARKDLVAKIGENIQIRRFDRIATEDGVIGQYLHGNRIGVLVEVHGGDAALAKDLAMHIAASRPMYVREGAVPADVVEQEKEVLRAQAEESGKPPEIVEKMLDGRLKKYLGEITLLGQPFVKDPDQSVAQLLTERGAEVTRFTRYEVGEGIEKQQESFADEVMAQVKGS